MSQKIFFSSDTHFSHTNIITYCKRPFFDVHEMNKALTDNWNSTVGYNDIIYHLGDFCFGNRKHTPEFAQRLNGQKQLIVGNHDDVRYCNNFQYHNYLWFEDYLLKQFDNTFYYGPILLIHNPEDIKNWNIQPIPGSKKLVFCGHVHEKWETAKFGEWTCINVGVDVQNMKPISLENIFEKYNEVIEKAG